MSDSLDNGQPREVHKDNNKCGTQTKTGIHAPVLLANDGISRQPLSVLLDRELRGFDHSDLEHRPPLGETSPGVVVRGAPLVQIVEALRRRLAVGSPQVDRALVHFDAGNHTAGLHQLYKRLPVQRLLVQSLLEQNHSAQELLHSGRREQKLPESLPVGLHILHLDARQPLPDGARALIGCQNTFPGSGDVLGGRLQLLSVLPRVRRHLSLLQIIACQLAPAQCTQNPFQTSFTKTNAPKALPPKLYLQSPKRSKPA